MPTKNNSEFQELKDRLLQLSNLRSAAAVLGWDQQVHMPKKSAEARGKSLAELYGVIHEKFLKIDHDKLLSNLKKELDSGKYSGDEGVIIAEAWREYSRAKKIPTEHVRKLSELTSNAHAVWTEARSKSNFSLFKPYLEKIVDLKRREAEYIGYKDSPYDALIDEYEPGMTAQRADEILNDLKNFLVPFIAHLKQKEKENKKKINARKIEGDFPIPKQFEFNSLVAEKMGYDLEAGTIEISTHPFTTSFHPSDVRFTTRYNQKNVLYALGSTIHEAGHALYEQGLDPDKFGTALGEYVSLGIHESQSRMWENVIGKSPEFWKYFYPKLQKEFPQPFKSVPVEDFMEIMNKVEPSYIRTESDEVTYNLHIIVRFEIERDLIEGKLKVEDAPKVWNQKMQEYLGVKVTKDSQGILQDVHWSGGSIGYFPTYSFGNLYAAQFYHQMDTEIPNLKKLISKGDFKPVVEWLRKKIHVHGKKFTADALIMEVTGEKLSSKYFADYLTKKYGN